MNRLPRVLVVSLCAIVLSTVMLRASDIWTGTTDSLTASLSSSSAEPCAPGTVLMNAGGRSLCVDSYEASPGAGCPYQTVTGSEHTTLNFGTTSCIPESSPEQQPWVYVSQTQATQLCARAGKRLPNAEEWYVLASGLTDEDSCVLDAAQAALTGAAGCATAFGVHDTVGNVWEWTQGEVHEGRYGERELPQSGFVSEVDSRGVVASTSITAVVEYGEDYATTRHSGIVGIMRGGYFGSDADGGLFAINLSSPLSLSTVGVGFRCVQDVHLN